MVVFFWILFGRNKSFFSLFGLWETLRMLWEALGSFGEALGDFGEALGGFGRLCEGFGEALGSFGEPLERLWGCPPPAAEQNYIQKCWEYANSR